VAFTPVTVTFAFASADGSLPDGHLTFTPVVEMRNGTQVVPATPVQVPLRAGAGSVVLYATDDPGTLPVGNVYRVVKSVGGVGAPQYFALPRAVTPVDLSALVPLLAAPQIFTYALATDLTTETARATGVEATRALDSAVLHLAGPAETITKDVLFASGRPWADVGPPSGVDDTAAILAAQAALPMSGGVVNFGPGVYIAAAQVVFSKANVTWQGAGMWATTIKKKTGAGATALLAATTASNCQNVTVQDLALDWDNPNPGAPGSASSLLVNAYAFSGLRVHRVRFANSPGAGITLSNLSDFEIDNCLFVDPGTSYCTAITAGFGTRNGKIHDNRWHYTLQGITVAAGAQSETIQIDNNVGDLGWYTLPYGFSGSGGAVTYSATVLTDTGAAFAGLTTGFKQGVRVLTPLAANSGGTVSYGGTYLLDTAAGFVAAGVKVGHIVRAGTAFAVISNVDSATTIKVEEWLSDTDRSFVLAPAAGAAYTVYQVVLGRVVSSTGTTITTDRWFDFVTGASVTPAAGTRYEVNAHLWPVYQIAVSTGNRDIWITRNRLKRGWADQIDYVSDRGHIHFNQCTDGYDHGITMDAASTKTTCTFNICRHNGAVGIGDLGTDNTVADNVCIDNPCNNNVSNTTAIGDISATNATRPTIRGNKCFKIDSTLDVIGIAIAGTTSGADIDGNVTQGHAQAGLRLDGAATVSGTRIGNRNVFSGGIQLGTATGTDLGVLNGTGDPTGVVAAPVGTLFRRSDGAGGTTLYVKETGTGTAGWTAMATGVDVFGKRQTIATLVTADLVTAVLAATWTVVTGSPSITMPNDGNTYTVMLRATGTAVSVAGNPTVAIGTSTTVRIRSFAANMGQVGTTYGPLNMAVDVVASGQVFNLYVQHGSSCNVTLKASADSPLELAAYRVA